MLHTDRAEAGGAGAHRARSLGVLGLWVLLLMTSCEEPRPAPHDGVAAAPAPTTTRTGDLPIPEISGLDYDEARELLLAAGWVPEIRDPGYGSSVEASSGNGPIFWSRGYREVESCSGTGAAACSFRFLGPNGEELVVVTEGEEDEDGAYHARVARSFLDPEGSDRK